MRILEFGFIKMGTFITLLLLVPLTGAVPFKTGRQKVKNYKPDLNYQLPTFYSKPVSPNRYVPMTKSIPRRNFKRIWHRKRPFYIRGQNTQRLPLNSQIPHFKRINNDFSFNKAVRGRHYLKNNLINYYNPNQSKNRIAPLRSRNKILTSILKNTKPKTRITFNNYKQNTHIHINTPFRNQRHKKKLFGFNGGWFVSIKPRGTKLPNQNRIKVRKSLIHEKTSKRFNIKKKFGDRNMNTKVGRGGWHSAKRNKKFRGGNKRRGKTKKRLFRNNYRHTRDINMAENAHARQTFYNLDEGNIRRKRSLTKTGMCDFASRPINIDIQDLLLPCDNFLQQSRIKDFKKELSFPNYQINCHDNSFVYPKENYMKTAADYNNRNNDDTGSEIGSNSGTYEGYRNENVEDKHPEDSSFSFGNKNDMGNFYGSQEKGSGVPDSETKYNGNSIPTKNFVMNERVPEPENVKSNNNERLDCGQQTDLKSPNLNDKYGFLEGEDDQDNANNYKDGVDRLGFELKKYFQRSAENDADLKPRSGNYDNSDNDHAEITRSLPITDENKKGLDYEKGHFQKPKSKNKHDRNDKDKSILDYVQPKAKVSYTSEPSNGEGLSKKNDFSTENSDYKQHENHKKTKDSHEKFSNDNEKQPSKHSHTRYGKYEDVHQAKEGVYSSSDNQFAEGDSLDLAEIPDAEFFESFRQSKGTKEPISAESEQNGIASASYKPPIAGSYMFNFVPRSINRPNQNQNPVNQAAKEETNHYKRKNNNLTKDNLDNGRVRSSSLQNGDNVPTEEDSSNLYKTRQNYQSDPVYGHYLRAWKRNNKLDQMSVPQGEFNNINTKNLNDRRVSRRNIENIKDYNKNSKRIVTVAAFTHGRTRNYSDRNGFTKHPSRNNRHSVSTNPDKKYLGKKMANSNVKTPFTNEKFSMDETAFINVSPETIKNYNGDTVRSSSRKTSMTLRRDENNRQNIGAIVSNSQTTGEIKAAATTTFKINRKRSVSVQENTNRATYEDSYPKRTNERSDKQNKEVSSNDYNADSDNDLLRDVTNSPDDKNKSSTERHTFNERLSVAKRSLSNDLKPKEYSQDSTDGSIIKNFTVSSEVPILEDNQLFQHQFVSSKDELNASGESDFDSKQNLDQENNLLLQETGSVPNSGHQLLFLLKINKTKRNPGKYTDDTGNKEDLENVVSGVPLDPNSIHNNESITRRIASNIIDSSDHDHNDNKLFHKSAENTDTASNSSIYPKKRDKKDVNHFTLDTDISIGPLNISEPDDSDLSRDNTSEANLKRFYRDSRKLSTNDTNCTDASQGCERTIPTSTLGTYSLAQKLKRRTEAVMNVNKKIMKKDVKMQMLSDEDCVGVQCFSSLNMRFHATWSNVYCGGWIEIVHVFGNGTMKQLPEKSGKYSKGSFLFNTKIVRTNRSYEMNAQDCNIPCSGLPEKLVIRGEKLTRQAVNKPWSDIINYMSGDSVDVWEPYNMQLLSPGSLCQKRNTSFQILLDGTDDDLSVMNMVFVEPKENQSPVNIKEEETKSQKEEKEREEIINHKLKITSNLKIALDKPDPDNMMKVMFNSILERTKKSLNPSKKLGLYSYASGRRCPGFMPLTNRTKKYVWYNTQNLAVKEEANNTFPELNAKLHFLKMSGNYMCSLGNDCEKGEETERLHCTLLDINMMNAVNAKEQFKNVS